ncbi:rhomboid family intramembrane serine protease [Paraburkholderia sp. DHOC27]|uniref:rhomboid family intramembrane serine protease n=1 Tax=Paraburkholderia sp. DHOC27 TaxID=2303330 RepID=UPI000E3D1562|nr:rhomboid family intramembrane serine protease [Paraburkholderia sp. DHOC27]RFU48872.1 rhomboid family intramembrane serine protease [Paraburkholderia sp. DHOC27]
MSQSEPVWGFVDTEVRESAGRFQTDLRFDIALGSRLRKGWGEVRARSFESKGMLRLSHDRVSIQTTVSRLLSADLNTDLQLSHSDIFNVRVNGRLVQFDLLNGPGELEPIILRAHDKNDAAAIVAAMPRQMTPRYATENHQRLRFLEQITARTPHLWSTWAIVIVTSLVYLAMAGGGAGFLIAKPSYLIDHGSNYGPYTLNGQWWRLLTSVFLHFSLTHITFNMIVLVQTGRIAERLFGNARFMALYLFAGLTGSLMSLLWNPGVNSAGASGAIFGVLGGLLAYVLRYAEFIPRSIFIRHFRWAAFFAGYNLFWGFTHHGIDNGAHVGGLIGGFMLACVLAPPVSNASSPDERTAVTLGASGALACAVISGLIWTLLSLSTRPDRQEAMHFTEALHRLAPTLAQASTDLRALPRKPTTQAQRVEFAQRIRSTVLPEWNQLYGTVSGLQVTAGSAEATRKDRMLHYFSDVCQGLSLAADVAEGKRRQDPVAQAQLQAILDDVKRTERR